jgi:hypothetical protein
VLHRLDRRHASRQQQRGRLVTGCPELIGWFAAHADRPLMLDANSAGECQGLYNLQCVIDKPIGYITLLHVIVRFPLTVASEQAC